MKNRSAVPWWAAFGAPLVGVPLLVFLLALGSPRRAHSNQTNTSKGYAAEQVDGNSVRTSVELPPPSIEEVVPPRC